MILIKVRLYLEERSSVINEQRYDWSSLSNGMLAFSGLSKLQAMKNYCIIHKLVKFRFCYLYSVISCNFISASVKSNKQDT